MRNRTVTIGNGNKIILSTPMIVLIDPFSYAKSSLAMMIKIIFNILYIYNFEIEKKIFSFHKTYIF